MKKYFLYILLLTIPSVSYSQIVKDSVITGKVNYQTTENIYVNFESTSGIQKDDMLFIKQGKKLKPAIKIKYISSKSVAGEIIGSTKFAKNDEVYAIIKIKEDEEQLTVNNGAGIIQEQVLQKSIEPEANQEILVTSEVKGRITMQSYSNFSNGSNSFDYQRWRYTFRLDAKHIGGSGLSYKQYINFAYRSNEWQNVHSNLGRALRIYDLTLNYEFTESTNLWFGRHINRKVSNLSAVDGLQFETKLSPFTTGLIVGSRPNFVDMGFNTKLFEYGIYVNRFDSVGQRGIENGLGYFEQTNNSKTDRRFLYYQHINTAIKNVRIFLSTEVDLYKNIPGKSKNDFSLTSLFVSTNIRPSKYISFYLSYDARKNVIYYETFKNFIDSVFENETRLGFNTRVTVKPVNNLYVGMNYGYRFRKGDPKPSNNYGGYITYSRIPFVETGLTLSFTDLSSTYIKGEIFGARIYKDFNVGFGVSAYYSNTRYKFSQDIKDVTQQSFSLSINTILLNPVYVSIIYEGIFQGILTSGRILLDLSYRF
ncbi:hypothetical protein LJE86_10795 [bacterium BMS3Abin03]|nr:hypothetical protein [bacterium BMS3Abin03]MCG6959756.1 hypothetical protein [bacterium BMS3Abin03]